MPQLGLNDLTLPENAELKVWHSNGAESVEIVFRPVFVPESVESDTLGCSACAVPHNANKNRAWSSEKPFISSMLVGDSEVVV